jgi:electron transport complex protein RnfC
MGGAMMGRALPHDQLPIVKASNCLIATPHAALRPAAVEMPCIRCAECAYACPVYLLPQRLLTAALSNNRVALDELGLADCIECGCCDYVCPSNITLAARFHAAKHQAEQ